GVPDVSASDFQPTLYLTGLESDSDYRTNIGLVNRGSVSLPVSMVLFDSNGAIVGTTTVTVPANNFQQAPLASYFPQVASRGYGALSLRADTSVSNAISVYASVIDNRTQDPIYLQASAMPSGSRAVIPAAGRAAGANGTFWRSDLRLFNATGTTMGVTLRYLPAGSDNRNAQTLPVAVPPAQTVVLADVLSQFGVSSGSGALELSWNGSAGPVIASRTYTTVSGGGTFGQSIAAVQAFGSDSDIPGLRSDAAFRSNVGFVNGGNTTIGIVATLLSSSGQTVGSAFIALPPRSQTQSSLAALFPGVDVASLGTVTLHAHTDSGPSLYAYGSIIDNVSGDPVFYGGM